MATLLVEVYDAFKDAGAPEEKSRAAASAIANYESRFNEIEADRMVFEMDSWGNPRRDFFAGAKGVFLAHSPDRPYPTAINPRSVL